MKIVVGKFTIGMVQTNFYYLHRASSKETIVFDPADHGEQIYDALTEQGLIIKAIFLTHAHFDHIWGSKELREVSGAPIYADAAEEKLCSSDEANCSKDCGRPYTLVPDQYLQDGEEITAAGIRVKMISTPGHTQGSCCYYITNEMPDVLPKDLQGKDMEAPDEAQHILISGDTLFEDSVGRTDLPTGSMSNLVHSVKEKLFLLPDDTIVYPGHGGETSIGHEKKYNEFI